MYTIDHMYIMVYILFISLNFTIHKDVQRETLSFDKNIVKENFTFDQIVVFVNLFFSIARFVIK